MKKSKKPLPLLALQYSLKETKQHMDFLISQGHDEYDYSFRVGSERGYIAGYLQALKDSK